MSDQTDCPHCGKTFLDHDRVFQHIYGSHGKTKARKFKSATSPEPRYDDSEAEYAIQGMIGER